MLLVLVNFRKPIGYHPPAIGALFFALGTFIMYKGLKQPVLLARSHYYRDGSQVILVLWTFTGSGIEFENLWIMRPYSSFQS